MQWNGMTIDWSVVKEWGIQVPAMGILFAVVCISMAAIVWIVFYSARTNRTLAADFRESVQTIAAETREHQREMRNLASEDSQELKQTLEETNRIIGRACERLDYHDRRAEKWDDVLRIYAEQVKVSAKT